MQKFMGFFNASEDALLKNLSLGEIDKISQSCLSDWEKEKLTEEKWKTVAFIHYACPMCMFNKCSVDDLKDCGEEDALKIVSDALQTPPKTVSEYKAFLRQLSTAAIDESVAFTRPSSSL